MSAKRSRRSLPSRGCGSKRLGGRLPEARRRSLPSRGADRNRQPSPSREADRGRSLHGGADRNISSGSTSMARSKVAPFTGARIETLPAASGYRAPRVAPFTGARIETAWSAHTGSAKRRSLPSRGRGSKPYRAVDYCVDIGRSLHGWFSFSSARRMVATLSADAAARSSAVQRVRDRAALI
jgi:hypothetical protein